jgi:hypothetical protein
MSLSFLCSLLSLSTLFLFHSLASLSRKSVYA